MKLAPPAPALSGICGRGLSVALLAALTATAAANYPGWWLERGVTEPHAAVTNDYAAANQGQLKWIASRAAAELEANLRHGAGPEIAALVAGFSPANHFAAVNHGQVKQMAAPFYKRLIAEGCAEAFPWSPETDDDLDFAAANVGQVKWVFSFNLDADGNGLPDWWEQENADALAGLDAAADADGDGLTAAQEYRLGTDLFDVDSDGDGVADALDATPTAAEDTDGDGLPDDWERFWFGNLAQTGAGDPDADGRSNALEFHEGSDPTRADADSGAAVNVFRPGGAI